ncbi:MAG: tetratricopeptide repeat protein [Granulosicoccus sp.]
MSSITVRAVFCSFFLLAAMGSVSTIRADQSAPELPGLFAELKDASDPADASRLEAEIWQHWMVAPDDESTALMAKISQAMEAADLAVALRFNDQLVKSHPEYAEGWNRRATLHYMLGNNAESVADIRETIALEPRHFGAISGLGLIFLRDQNFEAALDAFEKVLAISPASLNAQRSVERVRRELGREI